MVGGAMGVVGGGRIRHLVPNLSPFMCTLYDLGSE